MGMSVGHEGTRRHCGLRAQPGTAPGRVLSCLQSLIEELAEFHVDIH